MEIRSQIIWAKDRFALSRGHYHGQDEPCWYAVRKGSTGHWAADRSQRTLWSICAREDKDVAHSKQKPVECMRRPIVSYSRVGEAVYDPFRGSATTIIAPQQMGRYCYAIELNPGDVDEAVQRWQIYTGREATLDSAGQTFEAVRSERQKAKANLPADA